MQLCVSSLFVSGSRLPLFTMSADLANFWWVKLYDLTAWTFWDRGRWNLQLCFTSGDFLPTWGGVPLQPDNSFWYHMTLPAPFKWHGDWIEGEHYGHPCYSVRLGDLWLPMVVTDEKFYYRIQEDGLPYGQMAFEMLYVEDIMKEFVTTELYECPHVSFKLSTDA